MKQSRLNVDDFAFLIQRVTGATSLSIIDRNDMVVFSAGEEVDLVGLAADLRSRRTGEMTLMVDLPEPLLRLASLGDWILTEPIGSDSEFLVLIIAPGAPPEKEVATALELVLHGAKERKEIIDEIEHLAEVVRRQTADSLLETIARAQRDFILDDHPREVFARLLEDVLALTGSEYGFIGEVEHVPGADPFLRTWAITNIAWTEELRTWFDEANPTGIVFTNLDTLFGEVIRTGDPVVANSASLDPRSGGLPEGHPPLNAFLGLPFVRGDHLVGMVGLANRGEGYDDELIDRLEPFLATCSTLIEALRVRSEQEASESRLRMSEARTSAILESVVDAVIVTDESGTIDIFNDMAERTFGYCAAEVLGHDLSMLVSVRDVTHSVGSVTRVEDLLSPGLSRELHGLRKDGSLFPLEISVSEVEVESGQLFAVTCRDLTDKHQADRKIQMYAATIEATPDFVGVARVDGEILAINRAGRAMMGIDGEDPLDGLRIGDIHASWSRKRVREVGMPSAIRDGAWNGETGFLTPDGRELPMSQVIVVSRDADGVPQLVSTIARDISERKEIERVKSEFVSTVSHELRTPLTSIRGSLGLLSGGVLGELPTKASEMVEMAQTNTDRLIRLVNNILDFEKAQAGRLEIQFAEVDPREISNAAMAAVAGAAIEADVQLEVRGLKEPFPMLRGDADRLVQVLVNLLGNALKFSRSGQRVVLCVARADTGATEFSVTDRGSGIAPLDFDAIFEPFQQVDSSDRRAFGGSGLGLAIAKSIAEAHGGRLTVDSQLGVGSTFTLIVPPAGLPTSVPLTTKSSRLDVLIADVDPSVGLLVRRLLKGRGLTIADATTGHDVLYRVRHLDPGLLILDVDLPGVDGFEIIEQLRREGHAELPVVIFTERDLSSVDRSRLALGPTRYLTKSIGVESDLVQAICGLLRLPSVEVSS